MNVIYEQQIYQRPRISIGVFLILFFLLGFIPGIIYVIVKGNEVSKYDSMMAAMAANQQKPPPPPEPKAPDNQPQP